MLRPVLLQVDASSGCPRVTVWPGCCPLHRARSGHGGLLLRRSSLGVPQGAPAPVSGRLHCLRVTVTDPRLPLVLARIWHGLIVARHRVLRSRALASALQLLETTMIGPPSEAVGRLLGEDGHQYAVATYSEENYDSRPPGRTHDREDHPRSSCFCCCPYRASGTWEPVLDMRCHRPTSGDRKSQPDG